MALNLKQILQRAKANVREPAQHVTVTQDQIGELKLNHESPWLEHRGVRMKHPEIKFTTLRGRNTAVIGGVVSSDDFVPDKGLTHGWMCSLKNCVHDLVHEQMDGHTINHILINRYPPGGGIMPHEDGPRYFPLVNIVSLGSSCVMEFSTKNRREEKLRVFVPARSLLQFTGEAYQDCLHSIDFVTEDVIDGNVLWAPAQKVIPRAERYSLTFRHVPRLADITSK